VSTVKPCPPPIAVRLGDVGAVRSPPSPVDESVGAVRPWPPVPLENEYKLFGSEEDATLADGSSGGNDSGGVGSVELVGSMVFVSISVGNGELITLVSTGGFVSVGEVVSTGGVVSTLNGGRGVGSPLEEVVTGDVVAVFVEGVVSVVFVSDPPEEELPAADKPLNPPLINEFSKFCPDAKEPAVDKAPVAMLFATSDPIPVASVIPPEISAFKSAPIPDCPIARFAN
jgi:hypothetical protein